MIEIELDISSIKDINKDILPKDFIFIVGSHEYHCSKFQADLLSPKIASIHQTDVLFDTFEIKGVDDSDFDFNYFLCMMNEGKLYLQNPSKVSFITQVAQILGNQKIIQYFYQYDEITLDNVAMKLLFLDQGLLNNQQTNEIFEFCARNFTEIINNKEILSQCSLETLEMILSKSDLIVLESEMQLIDIISSLAQTRGQQYEILYQYVEFTNLTADEMKAFMNRVDILSIMNKFLWEKLSARLISNNYKIPKKMRGRNSNQVLPFLPSERERDFRGIITYLNSINNGTNCAINGVINVSASTTQRTAVIKNPSYVCSLDNLSRQSMWSPENELGGFIQFDFKDYLVSLTHYVLCTPVEETYDYPRSWSVLGSNDLSTWITLDVRNDESKINHKNAVGLFDCRCIDNNNQDYYRYIRIRIDGECWNRTNRYYFDISGVEFYGSLFL
ncbi:hypothetical protein TRFO_20409 [Tritrichomonas foetus]|uniref:F5/8 type C domain-containing protein n=1 Tax=Tritrichomonas foetus TaxID=1144522 RepID=A0A1J4KGL8_9EUKA|nr:hypothetical protein TRFO_20409 [Tritrichomonas foetus]|eukprot:OHT10363.1 hypothetical protein TRFO_20409 [Tritrichomonas foetus]